jgi:hypothetical protein
LCAAAHHYDAGVDEHQHVPDPGTLAKPRKSIGGQTRQTCDKLSKLFLTPKSDFTWLNQECAARNNHVKIGSGSTGFCKTFRNCWDLWVCTWCKKVYTRLILVCTGQYLVYSLFAHLEKHASNTVSLSMNKLGLNLLVISGALKYGMPQNLWDCTSVIIKSLHKVWSKFTPIRKIKFTQSLHTSIFLGLHRVYTELTRPNQACKPRVNHE